MERELENINNQRDSLTNGRIVLVLTLLRCIQEGYEPDDAGVKYSQNNFCNENRAVVLALFFPPRDKLRRHKNIRSRLKT